MRCIFYSPKCMHKNAFAAGAPMVELTAFPKPGRIWGRGGLGKKEMERDED